MAKQLVKQVSSFSQQEKEWVENIKMRMLTETFFIKADLNRTGERMGHMEYAQKLPLYSLKREFTELNQGMLNNSSLQQWSEDMDSSIPLVLYFLEDRMRNVELSSGVEQGVQLLGRYVIKKLEMKWDSQLREVAANVDEVAVFAEGIWLRSQMECVEFETKHITDVQFQWFTDIVSYLHVVTGEAVSTAESQRDAVNAEKGREKNRYTSF